MSNKVQKTLTAALTATIATGAIAIPAMAVGNQGNIDDLYKAAFEATIKTQDLEKVTQADINAARTAINALRGTAVENAVPTFSSIVDKAQQQFLTIAYNSIVECQKTETQKDVNTARTNIKDLPAEFKNAYSVAIDGVQQKKINAAVDAAEAAKKSLKAEDIKKAQALLDELNTVTGNDTVKDYVVKYDTEFKKVTEILMVEKIEVINNNTVRVQFNREVKDLTAKNFEIAPEKDKYDRVLIDEVKVSADKKSAEITTFDAFENKGKYTLSIKDVADVNGNKLAKDTKASFTYESAEVASIGFTTTNVPTDANLVDYIIIKDKLNRDVTSQYKDEVKFQSTDTALVSGKGKVSANEGKVMVSATLTTKDTTVESKGIMLTITKSAAASFDASAIITKGDAKKFSDIKAENKAEYVTIGSKTDKLVVAFKDQFGKEIELNKCEYTVVKNYNPDVVIVKDDKTIVPVSEGTGYVKVKAGKVEKTIAITVKAEANAATINLEKNSLKLATSLKTGVAIEYKVKDQYNNEVKVDKLDTKITNQVGEEVKDKGLTVEAKDGKVTIKPVEKAEEGLYVVTLTHKYNDENGKEKTITKNLTVDLVKAGDLNSYSVEVGATTLDVNGADDKDVKKDTTLTVYSLDENNNIREKVTPELEIKNEDGKDGEHDLTFDNATGKLTAVKEGTYTVKVKVGSFVTKQLTIKVEDTKAKATTVNLTQNMATVKEGSKVIEAIKALKPEVVDQFGAVMENTQITDAVYTVSAPENLNIKTDMFDKADQKIELKDGKETGSFELVIKKVTINGNKTNVASKIVKINIVADYAKRAQEIGAQKTALEKELQTQNTNKTNADKKIKEETDKVTAAEKKVTDAKTALANAGGDKAKEDKAKNDKTNADSELLAAQTDLATAKKSLETATNTIAEINNKLEAIKAMKDKIDSMAKNN